MYGVASWHELIQSLDAMVIAHLMEEAEEAAGGVSFPRNRPLDMGAS